MMTRPALYGLAALILSACGGRAPDPAASSDAPPQPERSEATKAESDSWSKGAMIAAANPQAVEAGLEMLRKGGSAVDAAIATHAVLGLVEPESSGIGGGAFMLTYDRAKDETWVYDGRETAPMSTTPNHFIKGNEVMGFVEAWQSGKAVGVPGQIALYKGAHEVHGQLPWANLFQPAIDLADNGFEVAPKLARTLANERLRGAIRIDDNPTTAAYFYPNGEPWQAGETRTNPAYAETLRRIAAEGPDAFYTGEIAEAIVAAVGAEPNPGSMTLEDLAGYEIKVRNPLCGDHGSHTICSAPPPSSGGVTQNMIYGLYEGVMPGDFAEGEDNLEAIYLRSWVQAQQLAYADRDHYVADADYVAVPADDLINLDYLAERALDAFAPGETPTPGDPGEVLGRGSMIDRWGRDTTTDAPGTTHLSIIDSEGNAVSMTATVEAAFGSSRMVGGFLLNNELTDFARNPVKNGREVANAPAAGKRPRSSMSPTLVFDDEGDLFMVTGSPGGNSIVAYVSKTLIGVLKWDKTAQEAVDLPNIIARGKTIGVEVDREGGPEAADTLRGFGYDVQERRGENSGLHVIVVREDGLEGAADPRRDGIAKALDQ